MSETYLSPFASNSATQSLPLTFKSMAAFFVASQGHPFVLRGR